MTKNLQSRLRRTEAADVTVDRATDPDDWNRFIERTDGPAFATWEWGELCEAYGHEAPYLVARAGGDLVGALPLVRMESRLFGDRLVSQPYAEYGGIVLADDAPEGTATALLDRTKRLADEADIDFVSLRGSGTASHPDFERKNRYVTFEIDLDRSVDALRDSLDDNRRRDVDSARDASVRLRRGRSLADLRDYYQLYLRTMRRHGTPPHSFAFFRRLWTTLGESGHLQLALATWEDKVVNGTLFFAAGDTVYDWGPVSDVEYRHLNGGSLLSWHEIEYGCRNGYSTFTFGRTREGSGVYMYKKRFGGEKVWIDDLHYFPDGEAALPDPDDDQYEYAVRAWRKLPLAATRFVGPYIRKHISL